MGTASKEPVGEFGSNLLWFVLHSFAAMPLAVLISISLGGLLLAGFPVRRIGDVLFLPLTAAIGCSLGFFLNRGVRRIVACLVWIVGVAWLAIGICGSVRDYDPRWYQGCTAAQNVVNAFFVADSSKCGGGSSTLNLALFTLPALASLGYSIGAYAGIKRRPRTPARNISSSFRQSG